MFEPPKFVLPKKRAKKRPASEAVKGTRKYKAYRKNNTARAREWRDRKRKEKEENKARLIEAIRRQQELLATIGQLETRLEDLKTQHYMYLLDGDVFTCQVLPS